jgi:hypothetical protein
LQRFANGDGRGTPPVARVLLGPAGLGTGKVVVLLRARGDDSAVFIENDSASSAGSDVDAEKWNMASFLGKPWPIFVPAAIRRKGKLGVSNYA